MSMMSMVRKNNIVYVYFSVKLIKTREKRLQKNKKNKVQGSLFGYTKIVKIGYAKKLLRIKW